MQTSFLILLGFELTGQGFRTVLSKDVPSYTKNAIPPTFERLLPSFEERTHQTGLDTLSFDWALHPGGTAIIEGAQETMNLSDDQLRATKEIYKTRGNSSSPTVLIVLDKLRRMGEGRDNVVAASFGPGLAIGKYYFGSFFLWKGPYPESLSCGSEDFLFKTVFHVFTVRLHW